MTDPELSRLLACLGRPPEDEVLWLAVADRLEEEGQPERAALLRLTRSLRASGTASACRATAESRIRELVNGGVRPCVPEITNSMGMRFALIPAGTFWMGSPEDEEGRRSWEVRHLVTLTRAFWLGVHPVTQRQYEAVMGSNPSYFSKKGGGKAKVRKMDTSAFPVEQVSWEDAVAFCEKLSALAEEKALGRAFRLPTEAEWEYSCRGGLSSGAFHFGNALDKSQANFSESTLGRTCQVGNYPPNAFGLFDMHGNVWEWCHDWSGESNADPVIDPTGAAEGTSRVVRGGGWDDGPCRSACLDWHRPSDLNSDLGFRVALVPSGRWVKTEKSVSRADAVPEMVPCR